MCRRSSSERLTVDPSVSPPLVIDACGFSSSALDTDADRRMSSSPIFRMSSTFFWKSGPCTSRDVTPSTKRSTIELSLSTSLGSIGSAVSAWVGATGATGEGAVSTRVSPAASAAAAGSGSAAGAGWLADEGLSVTGSSPGARRLASTGWIARDGSRAGRQAFDGAPIVAPPTYGAQHLGHLDRAVGLLVRLEQRGHDPRQRQPGAVERVDELGLRAGRRAGSGSPSGAPGSRRSWSTS